MGAAGTLLKKFFAVYVKSTNRPFLLLQNLCDLAWPAMKSPSLKQADLEFSNFPADDKQGSAASDHKEARKIHQIHDR
jgi:hypothetical protein